LAGADPETEKSCFNGQLFLFFYHGGMERIKRFTEVLCVPLCPPCLRGKKSDKTANMNNIFVKYQRALKI